MTTKKPTVEEYLKTAICEWCKRKRLVKFLCFDCYGDRSCRNESECAEHMNVNRGARP
jgi:hypothetical protein